MKSSKSAVTKHLPMIKAGGKVTHDARSAGQSFPKGSKVPMNTAGFNPMKAKPSTYGLKGI